MTGIFSLYFEPVVKPRENIAIIGLGAGKVYYTVDYIEPINPVIFNLGTVSSGSTSSLTELRNLDLRSNELGQWRILPLSDVEFIVKQPRAVERGTTKVISTRISPYLVALDPTLKFTEIYTFEDKTRIYIQAENKTNYDELARVLFFGWKFLLSKLETVPAKYTDIFVATIVKPE